MAWTIYHLLKNPLIESRLISQLSALFPENLSGTSPLPFHTLNKISLLEHAELESLRLHPPLGNALPRDTPPQGSVIAGVYVPGGVAVGVPAATIGRNPDIYPNPDEWDPDRWSDDSPTSDLAMMKLCFLGFGHGSRQCIGRNVANEFIMKMIGQLLLRYEIELEDPGIVLGTKEFTIQKPDREFRVLLRRREAA
jgi:cytochrome P450